MKRDRKQIERARERLVRAARDHGHTTIANIEHAIDDQSAHAVAICDALSALIGGFPDRRLHVILEAEISSLGCRARPEDFVAWIEGVGVFVIEVKSHAIDGIHSFQNGVPQVVYPGGVHADKDLLEQPKNFAYKLSGELSEAFDEAEGETPALYFAGWLPQVSVADVVGAGYEVRQHSVWLADMRNRDYLLAQLPQMKNLTRGTGARREQMERFVRIFGCTSGVRSPQPRAASVMPGTMGYLIDQRERQISILTREQERLAFNPLLVHGPKVVRGVVGSGKTVVLANAVAERYLRAFQIAAESDDSGTAATPPSILVLCYNRVLAGFLRSRITQCFEHRKSVQDWALPAAALTVVNIDRLAAQLARACHIDYATNRDPGALSEELLDRGVPLAHRYEHVFIDEAQDIDLGWYPLIRELAKPAESGRSITIFYDEAQDVYGRRRPGTGDAPTWTDLLGSTPHSMGLPTKMRIGHRNTNEILSLSFNLLLGSCAARDPQMAEFAGLAEYKGEKIPEDPAVNHPHAGELCVEQLGDRQYAIRFAVWKGPLPRASCIADPAALVASLVKAVRVDLEVGNVRPSDVLVMAPDRDSMRALYNAFSSAGIVVRCPCLPEDRRDEPLFEDGAITISTIKQAKGFTAHVVHVAFIEALETSAPDRERSARAELHVACTRATLKLDLWSTGGRLIREAQDVLRAMA